MLISVIKFLSFLGYFALTTFASSFTILSAFIHSIWDHISTWNQIQIHISPIVHGHHSIFTMIHVSHNFCTLNHFPHLSCHFVQISPRWTTTYLWCSKLSCLSFSHSNNLIKVFYFPNCLQQGSIILYVHLNRVQDIERTHRSRYTLEASNRKENLGSKIIDSEMLHPFSRASFEHPSVYIFSLNNRG